jgi:hypothetical protein
MNFDIAEFQNALRDTTAGELGSYFGAGRMMGGPFNGILWISNEWPGSLTGFSPQNQPQAPPQLTNTELLATGDLSQPLATSFAPGAAQQALPYPLCSESLAGQPFDQFDNGGTPVADFKIPPCASYSTGAIKANYPTNVRIINGYALDTTLLTKGFSLVSNVGMYLQGEYNTNSDTTTATSTPWIPAMLAADQITFLSNNWDDANSSWADPLHTAPRIATSTPYNLAVLMGWARSSTSMTLHVFPSMMEDWRTATITFNGSTVVGYYPVYERYGRYYDFTNPDYVYRSGPRILDFDKHFQFTVNQPPGAPLFFVSSLLDWKAE